VADRPTVVWTDALLDELRHEGDEEADRIATDFFEDLGDRAKPPAFFHVGRGSRNDPVVASWLAAEPVPPTWVNFDRVNRGAAFFSEYGLEIGLALFCSALPLGYASPPVANVLELTMQLESNTRHRVLETAQMVLDVTTPEGLGPGQQGVLTSRQVRLMHAGVRWLVLHDPRVGRPDPNRPDAAFWDPEWKQPVSQEHMLGALMAFSVRSLMALDTLRIDYDPAAAEDFMHLWSYVGYLLGIQPRLLPIDRASASRLDTLLMRRDIRATPAGRRLTGAIHRLLDQMGPTRLFRGLPRAATYALLGKDLAADLGVADPGWERLLFAELTGQLRPVSIVAARSPLLATVIRRTSREIMLGFVAAERHEGRPSFAIPEHLHDPWRVRGKVPTRRPIS
jgi:hypothetical protein